MTTVVFSTSMVVIDMCVVVSITILPPLGPLCCPGGPTGSRGLAGPGSTGFVGSAGGWGGGLGLLSVSGILGLGGTIAGGRAGSGSGFRYG